MHPRNRGGMEVCNLGELSLQIKEKLLREQTALHETLARLSEQKQKARRKIEQEQQRLKTDLRHRVIACSLRLDQINLKALSNAKTLEEKRETIRVAKSAPAPTRYSTTGRLRKTTTGHHVLGGVPRSVTFAVDEPEFKVKPDTAVEFVDELIYTGCLSFLPTNFDLKTRSCEAQKRKNLKALALPDSLKDPVPVSDLESNSNESPDLGMRKRLTSSASKNRPYTTLGTSRSRSPKIKSAVTIGREGSPSRELAGSGTVYHGHRRRSSSLPPFPVGSRNGLGSLAEIQESFLPSLHTRTKSNVSTLGGASSYAFSSCTSRRASVMSDASSDAGSALHSSLSLRRTSDQDPTDVQSRRQSFLIRRKMYKDQAKVIVASKAEQEAQKRQQHRKKESSDVDTRFGSQSASMRRAHKCTQNSAALAARHVTLAGLGV